MKNRTPLLLLSGAACLSAALYLILPTEKNAPTLGGKNTENLHQLTQTDTDLTDSSASPKTTMINKPQASVVIDDLPASLRETSLDGGLPVDENGHFIASNSALRLFNYFFSATGEEPDNIIRERVIALIQQELQSPADSEAIAFLDQFISYRDGGRNLRESIMIDNLSIDAQSDALKALRREAFGEELADTLFAEEELIREVHLERRAVLQNDSLTSTEKTAALAEIEARLPERIKLERQQASLPRETQKRVKELVALGANPQEVYQYRSEHLGEAAAVRLQALDQRRHALQEKVQAYIDYHQSLPASLSVQEKQQQLSAFLDDIAEGREKTRIPALAQLIGDKALR